MRYCCTELERKGTCYHEFQKGEFKNSFWHKDSLLLHDDILCQLHLGQCIKRVIPSYCDYGETRVTSRQWEEIYHQALQMEGDLRIVIEEINTWAKTVFETEGVFTILGI